MPKSISEIVSKHKNLSNREQELMSEALCLERIGADLNSNWHSKHEKIIGQHVSKLATTLEDELPEDKRPTGNEIGLAVDLPLKFDDLD